MSDVLLDAAKVASFNAHSPYSHFKVGSAVLAANGEIHVGCNVENLAFGSTVCAEVNAISSAIAHGAKAIEAVAIYTDTDTPTLPCGNCRLVMSEFAHGKDIPVTCHYRNEAVYHTSLARLLPEIFAGFE